MNSRPKQQQKEAGKICATFGAATVEQIEVINVVFPKKLWAEIKTKIMTV